MSKIWKPGDFVLVEDLQRFENGLGGEASTLNLTTYIQAPDANATLGFGRAITAALALNSPVVIDVPAGIFTIAATLAATLSGGQAIHLRGSGSATTIIRQAADADALSVVIGNYGPNTYLGGAFNVSGIGFEMAATPTAPRTALSITTTGVSGNTGRPLVLDDIAVFAHVGAQQWGTGVRIDGFANTAYLSRISCIFGNGTATEVGVSINGNPNSYSTAIFLNDVMLTGMSTGLVLGNYLQGIHIANLFTLNTAKSVQSTPTAGVNVEFVISGSYLMGQSVFRPSGTAALNTVRIVDSYFDWANTTPNAVHVTFDNCPYVTLIGNTFNGSVSGFYAPGTIGLSFANGCRPTLVQGNTFQNYGGGAGQTGTGVFLAASTNICNFLGNNFSECGTAITDLGSYNTWAHTTIGFQHYAFSIPYGAGITAANARFQNAGLSVGWNLSGGGGETDLMLARQNGATGGLNVYSVGFDGKVEGTGPIFRLSRQGGLGLFGQAPVTAQPAAPVTLADVIAIIRGCGLSA